MNFKVKAGIACAAAAVLAAAWATDVMLAKSRFEAALETFAARAGGLIDRGGVGISVTRTDDCGFRTCGYRIAFSAGGAEYPLKLVTTYGLLSASGSLYLPALEAAGDRERGSNPLAGGLGFSYGYLTDDVSFELDAEDGSRLLEDGGRELGWENVRLRILTENVSSSETEYNRLRLKLGQLKLKDRKTGSAAETRRLKIKLLNDEVSFSAHGVSLLFQGRKIELKDAGFYLELSEPDRSRRFGLKAGLSFDRILYEDEKNKYDVDGLKLKLSLSRLQLPLGASDQKKGADGRFLLKDLWRTASANGAFDSLRTDSPFGALGTEETEFRLSFDTEINDSEAELELRGEIRCPELKPLKLEDDLWRCFSLEGKGGVDASLFEMPLFSSVQAIFRSKAKEPDAKQWKYEILKQGEEALKINGKDL